MFWFSSRIHKQRVIPVFRGGKRTCIEEGTRPRKDRNLVPETVGEEQPAFALFFEKGPGYSLQWAESGFRSFSRYPVPCFDPRQPSRKNRNDTAWGCLSWKRKCVDTGVFNASFIIFCRAVFCCAEGASSSRQSPGRSVGP